TLAFDSSKHTPLLALVSTTSISASTAPYDFSVKLSCWEAGKVDTSPGKELWKNACDVVVFLKFVTMMTSSIRTQLCLRRLSLVVLPDVDVELGQHFELAFVEDQLFGANPLLEGLQDLESA
ncbi:MAG: hypothetical protein J2P13_03670, partial [Acidobacteria bacterium]|nr:hypothetical protein [Acidobacteriota bacterium]